MSKRCSCKIFESSTHLFLYIAFLAYSIYYFRKTELKAEIKILEEINFTYQVINVSINDFIGINCTLVALTPWPYAKDIAYMTLNCQINNETRLFVQHWEYSKIVSTLPKKGLHSSIHTDFQWYLIWARLKFQDSNFSARILNNHLFDVGVNVNDNGENNITDIMYHFVGNSDNVTRTEVDIYLEKYEKLMLESVYDTKEVVYLSILVFLCVVSLMFSLREAFKKTNERYKRNTIDQLEKSPLLNIVEKDIQ